MYHEFIEPSKQFADILIPGEGDNSDAVNILITKIKALLADSRQ